MSTETIYFRDEGKLCSTLNGEIVPEKDYVNLTQNYGHYSALKTISLPESNVDLNSLHLTDKNSHNEYNDY